MYRQLLIDADKCTGCGLCQLACAIKKTGQCEPSLARIKVWREDQWGLFVPMTCLQCTDPPCAGACLMNVISKDEDSGLTVRRLEGCIGCRACQAACPFEACNYNYLLDVVVNCDHCGGDPECVKFCPYGALQYAEISEVVDRGRTAEALRRINA
jgi:anaerobic carbon-monoxide dehydrogenase iron sulfur subunit